ncbi:MAG: hypothetical protein AAGF79_12925 [Pseudomonadota bacterium]
MPDYVLSSNKLKSRLKLARSKPIAFAYNPGKAKEGDYFTLHHEKSASVLSKAAKKDGPGIKVAFGMASVDGRVLELRCENVVPAIARRLKQHLKKDAVSLNIRVLDANGSVLEEDIEDLGDVLDDFDDAGLEETPEASEEEETPAPAPAFDAAPLVAGLKQLQQQASAMPDPAKAKLLDAIQSVVGMLKAQDFEQAQDTYDDLAAKMEKLQAVLDERKSEAPDTQAETPGGDDASAGDSGDVTEAASPEEANDDRLKKLAAYAKALKDQIAVAAVPDDTRDKLSTALQNAITSLKSGELDDAETLMDRIAEALTRLGMSSDSIRSTRSAKDAKKKKKQGGSEIKKPTEAPDAAAGATEGEAPASVAASAPDEAEDKDDGFDSRAYDLKDKIESLRTTVVTRFGLEVQTKLEARLDSAVTDLEAGTYSSAAPAMTFVEEALRLQDAIEEKTPDYARASSTGAVEDVQRMRILFESAVELVAGPDHAKAWSYLSTVQDMIDDGAARNVDVFLRDIPEDARPFAISRLNWSSARGQMKGELTKLHDSILSAIGNEPDGQAVIDNIGELFNHIDALDTRLSDKLDAIVSAEPGHERDTRKAEARAVLREYQDELSAPFFADVDGGNGFTNVKVAATARDALGEINKVLAA